MEIESIRIFVKVVNLGSFSRAAELLKLPKSTVSRVVSGLERDCGTKLLLRTTRSLTLTSSGKAFFESAVNAVSILEDARRSLYGSDSMLTGTVRLTAAEDFGSRIITPAIGKLTRLHPELVFEMHYTDKLVDLVKDGVDIAVRIGKLAPSSFKAKRVGEIEMVLVASKEFLRKHPAVKAPADLTGLDCLCFSSTSAHPRWVLRQGGRTVKVAIRPRIVANQMLSLIGLAGDGSGVALVPLFLCKEELSQGKLVRVLPEWKGNTLPVSIVSPFGTDSSSRLKIISDHLAKSIKSSLS